MTPAYLTIVLIYPLWPSPPPHPPLHPGAGPSPPLLPLPTTLAPGCTAQHHPPHPTPYSGHPAHPTAALGDPTPDSCHPTTEIFSYFAGSKRAVGRPLGHLVFPSAPAACGGLPVPDAVSHWTSGPGGIHGPETPPPDAPNAVHPTPSVRALPTGANAKVLGPLAGPPNAVHRPPPVPAILAAVADALGLNPAQRYYLLWPQAAEDGSKMVFLLQGSHQTSTTGLWTRGEPTPRLCRAR